MTPLYQEIMEGGLILFIFILIAAYRTAIWMVIKEFFLNLFLGIIFVGLIIAIFRVFNTSDIVIIYIIGVIGIFIGRFYYFHHVKK